MVQSGITIEAISTGHHISGFDCGNEALNEYLHTYARQNDKRDASRTFVAVYEGQVIAYFTTTFNSIVNDGAIKELTSSMPSSIGIFLLARLGVSLSVQQSGVGKLLMLHIFQMAIDASELAGLKALLVDAKDEEAAVYYESKFGFVRIHQSSLRLYLTIKEVRSSMELAQN